MVKMNGLSTINTPDNHYCYLDFKYEDVREMMDPLNDNVYCLATIQVRFNVSKHFSTAGTELSESLCRLELTINKKDDELVSLEEHSLIDLSSKILNYVDLVPSTITDTINESYMLCPICDCKLEIPTHSLMYAREEGFAFYKVINFFSPALFCPSCGNLMVKHNILENMTY